MKAYTLEFRIGVGSPECFYEVFYAHGAKNLKTSLFIFIHYRLCQTARQRDGQTGFRR